MKFETHTPAEVRIEVINLIDVMFLLLLFFILTTTFQTPPDKAIDYRLPDAASGAGIEADPAMEFVVDAEGRVHHRGAPLDEAALAALVEGWGQRPELLARSVVIRADTAAHHGRVIALMDLLRRNGLTNLAIGVREPGTEGP